MWTSSWTTIPLSSGCRRTQSAAIVIWWPEVKATPFMSFLNTRTIAVGGRKPSLGSMAATFGYHFSTSACALGPARQVGCFRRVDAHRECRLIWVRRRFRGRKGENDGAKRAEHRKASQWVSGGATRLS